MINTNRSTAIRKTWKNSDVAARRATRNTVLASGHEFRSTKQAFIELGLPLEKHIQFRMTLKAEGRVVFKVPGSRRRVTFTLADCNPNR